MWNPFKARKAPQSATKGSPVYSYIIGRRFDPGAEAEVFEQTFSNPVYMFRGNGRVAGTLDKLQPPQVYVGGGITIAGLGGIQAGQYVGQPLLDPSQLDNSGG